MVPEFHAAHVCALLNQSEQASYRILAAAGADDDAVVAVQVDSRCVKVGSHRLRNGCWLKAHQTELLS